MRVQPSMILGALAVAASVVGIGLATHAGPRDVPTTGAPVAGPAKPVESRAGDVSLPLDESLASQADVRASRQRLASCTASQAGELAALADTTDDVLLRSQLLLALGRIGAGDHPAVRTALDSRDAAVRHAAIRALASSGDSRITDLAPLVGDADATTRRLAIHSLGAIGSERARAVLEHIDLDPLDAIDRAFLRAALSEPRGSALTVHATIARQPAPVPRVRAPSGPGSVRR